MNLINRGFILVKPHKKLIEWVLQQDAQLLMNDDAEATVYLIEEDFWDDEIILKKYAQKIVQQEFEALGLEANQWPENFDAADIEAWFSCELGCTCIDLLKDTLSKEPI